MTNVIMRGRKAAERRMTLTLAWYSDSGTKVVVDGMEERVPTVEGTTPGKVQARSRLGGDTLTQYVNVADGIQMPVEKGSLHIPVEALLDDDGRLRLANGWECEVTAVGPYDDPALLGRRYRVVDAPAKSDNTARRLDVVDITRLQKGT